MNGLDILAADIKNAYRSAPTEGRLYCCRWIEVPTQFMRTTSEDCACSLWNEVVGGAIQGPPRGVATGYGLQELQGRPGRMVEGCNEGGWN